jgi:uncharacterized damage-inducible protein DinB
MTATELLILNFEEIRRRSLKLWAALSPEHYFWKPDTEAMSCIEMIRHILEGEHLFHKIVENRGNLGDYVSPWKDRSYTTIQDEIDFAATYREKFLEAIKNIKSEELQNIEIIRSEKNQRRKLGDYLQRIAYHEAVHTGQLLSYFRTIAIDRPLIWD